MEGILKKIQEHKPLLDQKIKKPINQTTLRNFVHQQSPERKSKYTLLRKEFHHI